MTAARCDALAKRIAELDPDWPRPGMAADMNGYSLRCVHRYAGDLAWVGGEPVVRRFHTPDDTVELATPVFDRPTVCVPDWRDAATLETLLLDLVEGTAECGDRGAAVSLRYPWFVRWRQRGKKMVTRFYDTRAEAILSAKLAQLEADHAR